jgi:hypothetical protein
MKELIYDYDQTDKVVGYFLNGNRTNIIRVDPAPEGSALDALVDDIATTIENYFGHFTSRDTRQVTDRLDPQLKPSEGTHSRLLIEGIFKWESQSRFTRGVRSWVTEGTLRSVNELTPVLREFVAARQLERRMHPDRVSADWKINDYDLGLLGVNFGLPAPPTRAELAAEYEARRKEEDARSKRDAAAEVKSREFLAQWEKENAIKDRKARLLKKLTCDFFTMEDVDVVAEPLPPEYYDARRKRNVFRECNKGLVDLLVDQGKTDEEIIEEMTKMNALIEGPYVSSVPDPLQSGEDRHYLATAIEVRDILAEIDSRGQSLTHITRVQLSMDGRFCVTIRPKSDEDYARDAEIDGGAPMTLSAS